MKEWSNEPLLVMYLTYGKVYISDKRKLIEVFFSGKHSTFSIIIKGGHKFKVSATP
jgi:hypothetical protein